jgi:hypothetical protein
MRYKSRLLALLHFSFLVCYITLPSPVVGQTTEHKGQPKEFCSNWNSGGDRIGFNEIREFAIPASGRIEVDGGKNGGISVIGSDRSDVTVKACVNAWGTSEANAQAIAKNVTISRSGVIRGENNVEDKNWGVSYQIMVPRNYDLKLTAMNGGIAISNVDGQIEFGTINGGVKLIGVGGDVRGKTTNGGVTVKLEGSTWRGNGLDVATTNGGVSISLPEGYAVNVETGTVNGGYKTDFPALAVDRAEPWRAVKVNSSLNGGGPTVKVVTTNGGVNITKYGPMP